MHWVRQIQATNRHELPQWATWTQLCGSCATLKMVARWCYHLPFTGIQVLGWVTNVLSILKHVSGVVTDYSRSIFPSLNKQLSTIQFKLTHKWCFLHVTGMINQANDQMGHWVFSPPVVPPIFKTTVLYSYWDPILLWTAGTIFQVLNTSCQDQHAGDPSRPEQASKAVESKSRWIDCLEHHTNHKQDHVQFKVNGKV